MTDAEMLLLFILTEPVTDPRSAFPCSGGESQALARLKHYFWDTVSTTFHGTHMVMYYLLCTMCQMCAFSFIGCSSNLQGDS